MNDSMAALFQRLTQGVYVVGVAHGEVRNAFTAAWVMQVSFDPLLLALSISPQHLSYALLKQGRAFSVNVLKQGQLELAAQYGRPARADKLALTEWTTGRAGAPLLREFSGLVRMPGGGRTPGRRPRAGAGKGDRCQAIGFQSRTHGLSRNRRHGWRLGAVSRRFWRFVTPKPRAFLRATA